MHVMSHDRLHRETERLEFSIRSLFISAGSLLLTCAALLVATTAAGLAAQFRENVHAFVVVALLQGAVWAIAAAVVGRSGGHRADLPLILAAAVLLNSRYVPISISVAPLFRGRSRLRRLAESQLIVDESWAVSARPAGGFDLRVLLGAGLLLYPCWVVGTALGVVGGGLLGDPNRLGLDGAFPALFLALLAPQVRGRRPLLDLRYCL